MASHHRKLLYQPLSDLAPFCELYCDNVEKSNGSCPLSCFNICPRDSCKQIIYLLSPPPPTPLPPSPLSPAINLPKPPKVSLFLTASLAVLATAFFIFTCYTIYRFYSIWSKSRRRRRPEEDGGPDRDLLDEDDEPVVDHPIWYIRTIGLQPSVINAITIVNYKKADGLVEGSDCAVCLSEFEEDETLRLLPKCSHAFHIPCIDTWLASHTNCPMCRAGIVSNLAEEPAAHDSGRAVTEGDGSQIGPGASENVEGGDLKVDAGELEIEMELDGVQVQVQGVRRSVSMDSISASVISAAVANALSDKNREKHKECCKEEEKEEDVERRSSVQTGSSSIKRSASCSAKLFVSRHSSRSRSMNRS